MVIGNPPYGAEFDDGQIKIIIIRKYEDCLISTRYYLLIFIEHALKIA